MKVCVCLSKFMYVTEQKQQMTNHQHVTVCDVKITYIYIGLYLCVFVYLYSIDKNVPKTEVHAIH